MRLPFAWAFLGSLLLLFGRVSAAGELRCEPAPIGAGTYSHVESVAGEGEWSVHFCPTPCAWSPQIVVKRQDYAMRWPSAASQAGMTARQLYREVYRLNAETPLDDPSLEKLVQPALRWAISNEPEPPACAVGASTAPDGLRPTYYLDSRGKVGHLTGKRVKPGVKCLCLPGQRQIGQGRESTYCAFSGADIEPQTEVAVCRP